MSGGCRAPSGPAVPGTEALLGLQGAPQRAGTPRCSGTPPGRRHREPQDRAGQGREIPPGAAGKYRRGRRRGEYFPLEKRQLLSRPGPFPPLRRPFWAARAAPPSLPAPAAPSRIGPVDRALSGWKFPSSAAPPPQKSPGRAVYARRRRRRSLAAPAAPPP